MHWGVDPTRAPEGAAATNAGPGRGWMPSRAARPAFVLLIGLLLMLGAEARSGSARPTGLLAAPPSVQIDLNRDPPRRLALIPGIGPRRARAIVEFRTAHGRFASSRDLLRVPGVGPGLMRRLAPFLGEVSPSKKTTGRVPDRR